MVVAAPIGAAEAVVAAAAGERGLVAAPIGFAAALWATSCGAPVSTLSNPDAGFDWVGRTVPSTVVDAMTVDVDPDKTISATPGEGVAVFAEYQSGGHWRVAWSCDTALSNQPCNYLVSVSIPSGSLANATVSSGAVQQTSPGELDAATYTTASLDEMTFDAPAGTAVTLTALIDGVKNGVSFFFVERGVVNGDYQGALTDPLILQPSSP
jgi:hypothetical protein